MLDRWWADKCPVIGIDRLISSLFGPYENSQSVH
jgi:hypothetical protein